MRKGINIGLGRLIGLIRAEEGARKEIEIGILDTPRDPLVPTLTEERHVVTKGVDLVVGHPQQIDLVVISAIMATIEQ